MSVQAITAALTFKAAAPSDKLLLLALANYADPVGACWPSHSTLAKDTSLSQRTILTSFKRLEAAGALRREKRDRPDGSRASDMITITLGQLQGGGEMVAPRGEAVAPPRGEMVAPPVGKPLQGGGEMVAPLTTFEPSTEPALSDDSAARTKRRGASRPIPDGFPDAKAILTAQAKATSVGANIDINVQAERFRNHALSKDRRCVDWHAAFRNWVAPDIEKAPKRPVLVHSAPRDDPWSSRLRGWDVSGYWDREWGPKPGHPGCRAPGRAA